MRCWKCPGSAAIQQDLKALRAGGRARSWESDGKTCADLVNDVISRARVQRHLRRRCTNLVQMTALLKAGG